MPYFGLEGWRKKLTSFAGIAAIHLGAGYAPSSPVHTGARAAIGSGRAVQE